MINYGISNTIVLAIPYFTTKAAILDYRQYKTHFSRQLNCWSLRCSWSIACRRCSNYIFILHLTPGFNILRKGNCKSRQETFQFGIWCTYIRDFTAYHEIMGTNKLWNIYQRRTKLKNKPLQNQFMFRVYQQSTEERKRYPWRTA